MKHFSLIILLIIQFQTPANADISESEKYNLANMAYMGSGKTLNELLSPTTLHMMLMEKKYSILEQELKATENKYEKDKKYEFLFLNSYEALHFDNANNYYNLEEYFSDWVSNKSSYSAYAGRGFYFNSRALKYRGSGYKNSVAKKDLDKARYYWNKAVDDFNKAIALNPKLLPVYSQLIQVYRSMGKKDEAKSMIEIALHEIPTSYYIRRNTLAYLQPKWGSSYDEAYAFIKEAQVYGAKNPRIWVLRGYVSGSKADQCMLDKNFECAAKYYDQALKYGVDNTWLAKKAYSLWMTGKHQESIDSMKQIIPYTVYVSGLQGTIRYLKGVAASNNPAGSNSPQYNDFIRNW